MGDKPKPFAATASKTVKPKRPSTVSGTSSASRVRVPSKEKQAAKAKINKNVTIAGDPNVTIMKQESSMPNFDAEYRQIAYGKFLRAMLEECLVDEKIDREQTEMDIQMVQLADRFQKTVEVLDKTSRRLKDVSFVVEQKRLLDLKNKHSDIFYEKTDSSNAQELLQDLNNTEQANLDKLETKNVDFGYNKESGHKQLLDAVNEAIDGLEQIKSHSKLDLSKFKEYERSKVTLDDLEKDRLDLDSLKADFEEKFPKFSEKLLNEVSEKIANAFVNDVNDTNDDEE